MVQEGLATAQVGNTPWCHPHSASSEGMQDTGVYESWRLPLTSERKAWESRQSIAGSELLWSTLMKVKHESAKVIVKMERWSQEFIDASNVDYVPRKAFTISYVCWLIDDEQWFSSASLPCPYHCENQNAETITNSTLKVSSYTLQTLYSGPQMIKKYLKLRSSVSFKILKYN